MKHKAKEAGISPKVLMEVEKKLEFINDIVKKDKLEGISANMLDGLNSDMIELAKKGVSPVCAVEKRLAAHKL